MNRRSSIMGWAVATATSLLLVAVVLTIAVNLLQEIWPQLVVIGGVAIGVGTVVWWLRSRPGGW